jgi:hypothetical protein
MIVRRKWMVLTAVAVVLMLAQTASAASAPASVSITATVDTFAEWANASPAIVAGDWTGHVGAVNQTRTASKALTLYANVTITLTPTGGTNLGILTNIGADTLATSYMITGDATPLDIAYKPAGTGAGEFFAAANTYTVTHVAGDGSYAINLLVQAVSPNDRAPDAGDYTCGVTLTASW